MSVQVFSPVPRPATSSRSFASYQFAGLTHTTEKDLAVLEHGMIWTGVTNSGYVTSQNMLMTSCSVCWLVAWLHHSMLSKLWFATAFGT